MRLRKGQRDYKIPEHWQIMQVFVTVQNAACALQHVTLNDWFKCREGSQYLRSLPKFYYVCGNNIMLYPIPDKAYTMTVRYLPLVKEV